MRYPLLSAAIFGMLSACGNVADAPTRTTTRPTDTAGGGRVYGDAQRGKADVERWCTTCHVAGATGSDGAPALALLKKDPGKTAAYIRGFLQAPHKPMPPVTLTNQEIEDIISYLLDAS